MVPACLKDAAFYSWRGAVLLALGMPQAAIEDLERALLLQPDLPGTKLDYAQALMETGDSASASGFLQQLAQLPDLPAHLQPLITQTLVALRPAPGPEDWRTRWVITTAVGADSNLNNAPSATELTINFPWGPVTLPVQDRSRPKSGASALLTAQWQGIKPQGGHLWSLQADIQARHTALASARYQQADLSAGWLQAPDAPSQWIALAALNRVDMGGQTLLRNLRTSVLHQWQPGLSALAQGLPAACRPSLGVEAETSHYPLVPQTDGRYTGLLANVSCIRVDPSPSAALFGRQQIYLQLRRGSDQALGVSRAGGDFLRSEFRAIWEGSSGPYALNADYSYTRQSDGAGYSPLLQDNLRRTVSRHSLRLELSRVLAGNGALAWPAGAEVFISAEGSQQDSNLVAFVSHQRAIYIGLRWSPR